MRGSRCACATILSRISGRTLTDSDMRSSVPQAAWANQGQRNFWNDAAGNQAVTFRLPVLDGTALVEVGLYARVSTHDQQTLPMQLSAMRSYARKRGWTVAVEVKDVGSGATARPLREKLIETARRREIDLVLVWRLDRWGRSLVDLVSTLQELTALEVGFVSLSEALDLTTPSGRG